MVQIHHALLAKEFPNSKTLAKLLEVSSKSVRRDIEFMKDRLSLPIEYHPLKYGYHYTEEVNSFPSFQVTEGELFALLAAEKALQQYRGTPFEKPLLSAFRKISQSLPDTITISWADWDATLSFKQTAESLIDHTVLGKLSSAAADGRQVEFDYRKPGSKAYERRRVDPYHLANVNGEWYLFAHCHLRGGIRTFSPLRMKRIEETGKCFARPKKFQIEHELKNSFGILSGDQEIEVRIWFSEAVSDYIREKRWHASQQISEQSDGSIIIQLRLSSLLEVQRWILGWGGEAIPIAPDALIEGIKASADRILKATSIPKPEA